MSVGIVNGRRTAAQLTIPARFLLTASSAMLASCLSSVVLGSFMCGLVLMCRKFGLDPGKLFYTAARQLLICGPDNIAPPVAACLGDLVTLLLLGLVSTINIYLIKTPVPFIIIIVLTVAAVGWAFVTRANRRVSHLLSEGWIPLFVAMIISCGTGIVLDLFASRFEGFALLAAVISGKHTLCMPWVHLILTRYTGLPGNVGSILVSRLSTALHGTSLTFDGLPSASSEDFNTSRLPSKPPPSTRIVMITLCCVTLPIEVAFLATLRAIGWLRVPFIFLAFSLFFFCVAVST